MTRTPSTSPAFIRRIEVAPGESVTIPASHVARTNGGGYVLTDGIGRQASTARAAE